MRTALSFMLALAVVVLAGSPHDSITYLIVPFADVTPEMIDMVAQTSTNTLRHTVSGPDLVALKFARYKQKLDPMPTPAPNDEPLTETQLDYNEKFKEYKHAHKKTPAILTTYKQYSYTQILAEMKKPEWNAPLTNIVDQPGGTP